MIKTDDVKKHLNAAEVANLPETLLRAEAAFHELLDDILDKCPSAEESHSAWGDYREIGFDLSPKTYSKDVSSLISTSISLTAPFDEVMACANDMSITSVSYAVKKTWFRRDVEITVSATVRADMDKDYLQTLRDLGKVRVERPSSYSPPAQETIYCPLNKSNDIPF